MKPSDVILSPWAEGLCEQWGIDPDEVRSARVEGVVIIEESHVDAGWVVIWGPRRDDGSHLHIVCGPPEYLLVNDFRPLRTKPSYAPKLVPIWPADDDDSPA
jgi:hypothetical protein